MSDSEQWSVVPHRDKQKSSNGVKSADKMIRPRVDDKALIGSSFMYNKSTQVHSDSHVKSTVHSDSDLIGAPFIVNEPSEVDGAGNGAGRGILKLTPEMFKEMEHTQVEFTLSSTADWPAFSHKSPRAFTELPSDNKSWSTVLKSAPPPPKPVKEEEPVAVSDDEVETPKKKKKKKKAPQEGLLKDKQPLMLELGSLFESLQVKGSKKVVLSTGGGAVVNKAATNQIQTTTRGGGNILDSSAPLIRRGKEREQPKKRKPTPLRKIIDREKDERKVPTKEADKITAVKDETNEAEVVQEVGMVTTIGTNDEAAKSAIEELEASKMEMKPVVKSSHKPHPPKTTPTIHNRRFREYCTHVVNEDINECARTLLSELLRFQDRQHQKDPVKARVKKRYVCGMREVLKHLKSRRVKCLIVAPNMERIQSEGGIDDVIGQILALASEQDIPIIFALSRRALAVTLKKSFKVGCVGIFRHEGAEIHYKRLLELVEQAREQYKTRSAGFLATTEPPMAESDDESSVQQNRNGAQQNGSTGTGLEHTPWGVFFNQSTKTTPPVHDVPQVSTNTSHHVTSSDYTVPSHMIPPPDHVTGPFNVFAKEFVPSLNVHAPEYCPTCR